MTVLGEVAQKVRSKNAGPFWLTVDIFCGSEAAFRQVSDGLSSEAVADAFQVPVQTLKRFDIGDLNVVKFSLPRPAIQGAANDRDLHGASFAEILAGLTLRA